MENVFAYAVLTKDGMTITKFGDNCYGETSPDAAQKILETIASIGDKNVSTKAPQV